MMFKNVFVIFGFLAVCYAAAGVGVLLSWDAIPTWYVGLNKPSWNPPNWVFGPVWMVLYTMMAIAAWRVWKQGDQRGARLALGLFWFQLVLNVAWSGVFFGLRQPDWAFLEIVILWLAILATALAFRKFSRFAFWMMIPYLAWVGFAAVLNLTIWRMNA